MIAYDNSAGYYTVTGTTLTQSFTVGTGSNRFLVVNALTNGTVTGVTYGGVAMTKTSEGAVTASGDSFSNTLWYLFAPASGANNVVITCSGSASIYTHFSSYKGVLQSGLNTSGTANTAGATSLAISLTTTLDNCWLIGSTRITTGGTVTAGTNTTMRSVDHTGDIGDTNSAQTPAGSYSLNVNNSASSAITWLALAIAPAPATFKTATVSAGDVPATQTDFPSYVDLSRLGITTLAEAQSVRVYADAGKTTEWAREIVSATEMHVKIPSLTSTTSIYVDWDGVRADYAVTDTYGRNAVWSAFRSVHHLNSSGVDSTGNLNNTDVGLTYSAGQIGDAATFSNGSSSRVTTTTGSSSVGTYTYFAWFKSTSTTTRPIVTWTDTGGDTSSGYQININLNGAGTLTVVSGPTTSGTYNDGNWHRVAVTGNGPGNAGVIYVDGASVVSGNCFNFGATTIYEMIGRFAGASKSSFDGTLDEHRWWVGSLLSANWIAVDYNNQSDEAGFWGTWSDVGGATDTTKFFYMA